MKKPKNATHKSKGNHPIYYQKLQDCNAYRKYSKVTGRLLNTVMIFEYPDEHLITL